MPVTTYFHSIYTTIELKREIEDILSLNSKALADKSFNERMFAFEQKVKTLPHKNIVYLISCCVPASALQSNDQVIRQATLVISTLYHYIDFSKITCPKVREQLYDKYENWHHQITISDPTVLSIRKRVSTHYNKTLRNYELKQR